MDASEALRALPQVDQVLRAIPSLADLDPIVARWLVRREIDGARARLLAGGEAGDVTAAVDRALDALDHRRVQRVINATGVVLHTNLGRAPLSDDARGAVVDAMGTAAVEYDLATGQRAGRAPVAATLAAALCDAADALVVNNNAGALLLALGALARDREVVVARGELIEIGGSFRLPDVMEASGAVLREVGTTNRTRAKDYRKAINPATAMLLKVHPSNYEIVGFAEAPSAAELAEVAHAHDLPLLFDIGSGLIGPLEGAFADEPDARSALAAGADLVCFSGDKLLGGPQAGILAGSAELIERCRRHPIARAVRADKLTLAALEATLLAHARGQRHEVPVWRMLAADPAQIEARARAFADRLDGAIVEAGEGVSGGGSLPGRTLPTTLVRLPTDDPQGRARALRAADPPVIVRVDRDAIAIDLRTVDPADEDALIAALV